MSDHILNPWDLGHEVTQTSIPEFCTADFMLVKLAPPKGKTIRDGVVASFIMTGYYDEKGNKISLVDVTESAGGYKVEFPLGKRGLFATKFRGPSNFYKFKNPETGKWFQISQDKLTIAYAREHLGRAVENWTNLSDAERDVYIDTYLEDIYMFGLSNDIALAADKNGKFTVPVVGLQTKLYRVYSAPKGGSKYPDIKITKWEKGYPELTGEHKIFSETIALAIHDEYQKREETFDPSTYEIEEDDVI